MARINFILPFLPTKPVGGAKNVFQFANRLQAKGHSVALYYSIRRPFKKQKTPVWLRMLIMRLRASRVGWFSLDASIEQHLVPEISDDYVRDAEASICTWWQMAYAVEKLSPSKGSRCNFIQDYELWTGQEDRVHDSYKLPMRHMVIAQYLQDIVEQHSGKRPPLVNTPIDINHFTQTVSSEDRNPATLIMMYSEEPRKGTKYGIEALQLVRQKIPHFKATMFSVYNRPDSLPDWIDFHTRPSNLPELYNQHALFFSPSLGEGWGLPPAESMACGCAVVCTDIGGHRDYAVNDVTALLVESKNPADMASKIITVIEDRELRLRLANAGHRLIRENFTWENAVSAMEQIVLRKDS